MAGNAPDTRHAFAPAVTAKLLRTSDQVAALCTQRVMPVTAGRVSAEATWAQRPANRTDLRAIVTGEPAARGVKISARAPSWHSCSNASSTRGVPQFQIVKEEAAEQIAALTRDRDFLERPLCGDHEATVKMKALHAVAHRQG
jgi:hypothetical protein